MNSVQRFFGHLKTITRHRHYVFVNCVRAGIPAQGLVHDLSKFSPTEFIPGVRYFQGNRSPNAREREVNGMSLAWMHHKGRNRHHFEYWLDINTETGKYAPVPMPRRYVIEMFCDRIAACKVYLRDAYKDSSALDYFKRREDKRDMHPDTCRMLTGLLEMLAEKGEKQTFAYIRGLRKEG